jgi:hypothetical protein
MTKPQVKLLHPCVKFGGRNGFRKTRCLNCYWEGRLQRMVPLCEYREAPAGSEDDTHIFPEPLSTENADFSVGNLPRITDGYDQWTSLSRQANNSSQDDAKLQTSLVRHQTIPIVFE